MTAVGVRPAYAAPLRAVDRYAPAEPVGGERRLVAHKTVTAADPYMAGHFPGLIMLPAVFLLEAVRQVVAADQAWPGRVELLAVHSIRVRAPMRDGDEIRLDVALRDTDEGARATVHCRRQDGIAVAELKVTVGPVTATTADAGPPPVPPGDAHADHARIRELLPVRHPILLVDRILSVKPGAEILTAKAVTGSEPCYTGLPDGLDTDAYAYPRSLALESFGQSAALLWLASALDGDVADGVLMVGAIRDARFHSAVQPGEVLHHVVRIDNQVGRNAFFTGETWAGNRCVATIGSLIAASRPALLLTGQRSSSF
jgi:3-hydroxymyristoyl/3-hydroxydecanoyl-(acyl carrier protein) dehydratase